MIALLRLLLAHVIADFLLQSGAMAANKNDADCFLAGTLASAAVAVAGGVALLCF